MRERGRGGERETERERRGEREEEEGGRGRGGRRWWGAAGRPEQEEVTSGWETYLSIILPISRLHKTGTSSTLCTFLAFCKSVRNGKMQN